MNNYDILRKLGHIDEEINLSDLTDEQIKNLFGRDSTFKEKYFDFHDDVKDKSLRKQDW